MTEKRKNGKPKRLPINVKRLVGREVEPRNFPEANILLKGATDDVGNLPVFNNQQQVISCWNIPLLKRLKILITGKVWLGVKGNNHPPVWIDTEAFETPNA